MPEENNKDLKPPRPPFVVTRRFQPPRLEPVGGWEEPTTQILEVVRPNLDEMSLFAKQGSIYRDILENEPKENLRILYEFVNQEKDIALDTKLGPINTLLNLNAVPLFALKAHVFLITDKSGNVYYFVNHSAEKYQTLQQLEESFTIDRPVLQVEQVQLTQLESYVQRLMQSRTDKPYLYIVEGPQDFPFTTS